MTADPFAEFDAPKVEEAPVVEPSVWTEKKEAATVTETPDNKVRVTLKGGAGYAAPWITLDGESIPDTLKQMTEYASELKELIDQTAKVGAYFSKTGGEAAPAQAAAPAPQQAAPNGETKTCKHGEMKFKTGFSQKTNKTWKAFMCPAPKGTPDQCPPEWA